METKSIKLPGPDHPITIEPNPVRVIVSVAGRIIADTRSALTLNEAGHAAVQYIPQKDVEMTLLKRTDHHTYCPYKGDCSYYTFRLAESGQWMRCGPTKRRMQPSPRSRITSLSIQIVSMP
jgi:uncharacterized protein (DUF427 family)